MVYIAMSSLRGTMTDSASTPLEHEETSRKTDIRKVRSNPNYWYPVAWSSDVKPGKTYGTWYAGEPIALIRPQHGTVFALEDRCAHRQVPLSEGVVCGDAVKCCYHGWSFGRSGRCIDVPYLGKNKLPNGVKTYPCKEQDNMIFIFPGDPQNADKVKLEPHLAHHDDRRYKTRYLEKRIRCHYSFMHENLMDMNHQFMHSKQMGEMKPRFLGKAYKKGLVEARYSFARTGGKQPLGETLIFGERRGTDEKFQHHDVMTIRTEYPYQTLRIHTSGDPDPVMDLWIVYTPQGRDELANRTFGLLSVKRPKIPFILDIAWPFLIGFTNRIFAEDKDIVEMEQQAWRELGGDHNNEVFPVIRLLRELLVACGV